MQIDAAQMKRLRGMLIELVNGRHVAQQSRADHVMLWHMARDLGCDVGENDVVTALQDLFDRGYVRYTEDKDRKTNSVRITLVQLTPAGRDLLEGTKAEAAIQF